MDLKPYWRMKWRLRNSGMLLRGLLHTFSTVSALGHPKCEKTVEREGERERGREGEREGGREGEREGERLRPGLERKELPAAVLLTKSLVACNKMQSEKYTHIHTRTHTHVHRERESAGAGVRKGGRGRKVEGRRRRAIEEERGTET